MGEQRNLVLAIVLSVVILLGYQLYFAPETTPPDKTAQQAAEQADAPAATTPTAPGAPAQPETATGGAQGVDRETALADGGARVAIESGALHGSIRLQGARIDDLTLARYHETIEETSPEVVLLSPHDAEHPYWAEFGWVTAGGAKVALPDADTPWQADRDTVSPGQPVTLTWENGQGLRFVREIAVDENYMFTVTQRVENSGGETVTLYPYGLVSRTGKPDTLGYFILHEGPLGVFDGTLDEVDYDDLVDDGPEEKTSTGGWLGITDKYWLAALVPDQNAAVKATFRAVDTERGPRFQTDYVGSAPLTLAPGGTVEATNRLFAGAKVVQLLDAYEEQYGIANFDLAVDFGWFYFLTKPIFYAIDWIASHVGNFGLAILILTIFIKALLFPLANISYRSMARMRKLKPKMDEIRERLGDDRQKVNQEMMALYKQEKVNPASGCLPMLLQIPVFFSLYKVLFVTIEMRHAPFFGWIHDLSAPDPLTLLNGFGLITWNVPEALHIINIGLWPIIMGLTMFFQQRLNPPPPDPTQAKIFMMLPIVFTFVLARFPAGLVIYWTWNNLLSISQQRFIMWRVQKAEEREEAEHRAREAEHGARQAHLEQEAEAAANSPEQIAAREAAKAETVRKSRRKKKR
jgi:YidC/Oxa1 family membrane protein insertase